MRAHRSRGTSLAPWRAGVTLLFLGVFIVVMGLVLPSSAASLETVPFKRSSYGNGRQLLDVKESTASDGRDFLQFQTRRNWAGEDVSSQFCSYDEASDSCNWEDYGQSLSLLAVPPAVIGIFFFFIYVIGFILRCCCVSARKCMLPWTTSFIEPWILRLSLIILSVFIMGMAVMGHVGNAWAHEGINGLQDDASDYGDNIVNITYDAADLLVRLDSSYNDTANTVKSQSTDVDDSIDDFIHVLEKVEIARFTVFLVTFIAIFGTGVSAFLSICCFRRGTFCSNYWYAVGLFVPIMGVMIFCIVFGAAGADVCTAYDSTETNSTNNIFSTILGNEWGVDCTAMEDLLDPLLNEYNQTIVETCTYYTSLCAGYPGVSNCQSCSSDDDLNNLLDTTITETFYCSTSSESLCLDTSICATNPNAACYNQTQTFEECETQCRNETNRNVSATFVDYIDLYNEVNDTIDEIMPYVGCGLITEFVSATDESLCVDFMAGVYLVVVATIVLAGLWIFYQLTNILAYERAGIKVDKD